MKRAFVLVSRSNHPPSYIQGIEIKPPEVNHVSVTGSVHSEIIINIHSVHPSEQTLLLLLLLLPIIITTAFRGTLGAISEQGILLLTVLRAIVLLLDHFSIISCQIALLHRNIHGLSGSGDTLLGGSLLASVVLRGLLCLGLLGRRAS